MEHSVVFVQEALAAYRVPFYERLRESLNDSGVAVRLVHGRADEVYASRRDEAVLSWADVVPAHRLTFGRLRLVFMNVFSFVRHADLVIVEHANRHVVNYALLAWRLFGGPPVAYWGHGADLQTQSEGFRSRLRTATTAWVDWWFAYTEGSARRVTAAGYSQNRITVVNNSTYIAVPDRRISRDREAVCFVGSLHRAKRIGYLLDALAELHMRNERVTAHIIGDGPEAPAVRAFADTHDWVTYHGRLDGEPKSSVISECTLMLNPGMVGLNVVDAFVCGTPIVTIEGVGHSPEFEYIRNMRNGVVCDERIDPSSYARRCDELLQDAKLLSRLRRGCDESASTFTLDRMVANFSEGVLQAIRATQRADV